MKITCYRSDNEKSVSELLTPLKDSYPGFSNWLHKKLNSDHTTYLAFDQEKLAGVVIGSPKTHSLYKINTFYVNPEHQNRKIGTQLMEAMLNSINRNLFHDVYITADSSLTPTLGTFLSKYGFIPKHAIPNKYRRGKTEIVYYKHL